MQPLVSGITTLRGLDLVAASTIVAELGDLRRFAHPRELLGYVGLVPVNTQAAPSAGEGRSPRWATGTCAGY